MKPHYDPQIPANLLAAYRNTTYVIDRSGNSVRIGELSPAADRICGEYNATSWIFITAYNPRSELLSRSENEVRMEDLRTVLVLSGMPFLEGEGQGEDAWEPEQSFFAPGVSKQYAIELGLRFEQYAVDFGEVGKPAELLEIPLPPKG